jgi:hypothetical protein
LGRSYHYQDDLAAEKPHREDMSAADVLIRPVGGFSDASVAIKTARACAETGNIAWANLDGEGRGHMVVDGISKDIPGGLEGGSPVFSKDGTAFGYILNLADANVPGEAAVLLTRNNDRTVNEITRVLCRHATDLTLSDDGSAVAYCEWRDNIVMVHVNDSAYGPYDGMPQNIEHPIVFSKNGKHNGFLVNNDGGEYAIIDGKAHGPYEGYREPPIFSADGKRFAYDVKVKGKTRIVDTGKQGRPYDGTVFGPSIDLGGNHVAYGAIKGDKAHIVVDGEIVETLSEGRAVPRLSPDGKKMAKIVAYDDRFEVIIDDKLINTHEQPEQVIAQALVWSPDSSRIAYLCGSPESRYIMVDRDRIGPIDDMRMPGIVFSQDGGHYAVLVKKDTDYVILLDGKIVDHSMGCPVESLGFLPWGALRLAEVDVLDRRINWVEATLKATDAA